MEMNGENSIFLVEFSETTGRNIFSDEKGMEKGIYGKRHFC